MIIDLSRSYFPAIVSSTTILSQTTFKQIYVDLIYMTLAFEVSNSKLVEVVTVADADTEDHVGNSLLQIWELTFGPKAKLLFRL